ncbi:MAG TPA: ADP-ribosylglycohydrolase family protein [Clostridia bacterium]|nr:ADP-ribosylglycohydrolase family protein [Clostridia bacterium]
MFGAIVGDIVGSAYEYHVVLDEDLPLLTPASSYTDETVLTVAVADCLLHQRPYGETLRAWALANPGRRYSTRFAKWTEDPERTMPTSYGNGAAGRVSPVGWAFDTLEETLAEARRSAEPTHNHADGIAGAQAVAAAVFLARTGVSKDGIRDYLERTFRYDLRRSLIDCTGGWFEAAELSVPEAVICFLQSTDVRSSLQNAVNLRGDADTQAAIAGSIAEAFYHGIPADLSGPCLAMLPADFRSIIDEFRGRFHIV